jgi:transposase
LRKLLVVGAHAVLFHRKFHTNPPRMWAKKLIEKKPFKLVAVALANKMARIAFAITRGRTVYREIPAYGAPIEFVAKAHQGPHRNRG